jgi:P4 family phage/plasmid primase-like protien
LRLREFNALVGQDSYVRCQGKERIDPAIVSRETAENHLFNGGTIGWWVRTGYIVVDIDEGKQEALNVIKKLGLQTLMCKTPKGIHLYFKCDKEYPQKVGMVLPFGLKCDFRCANKGYVLLPFGADGRKFSKVHEIAEMPLEFTPIPNRKDSLLGKKDGDGRNATLFAHLMAYKHRGATDKQLYTMADVINQEIFSHPMSEEELEKIVSNTKKYEAQMQGENPYLLYTAKGIPSQVNARAMCDYFVNRGDLFVMVGECYQYVDGVYQEASSYVRNTIKEMIAVDSLITQARIMECFRLLLDDTRIQVDAADLNSDKNLINFKNGVWDIEQAKLLPHDSKFLQTLQLPHEVPERVKKWEKTALYDFLVLQCELNPDEVKMIVRFMAYCLTLGFGLKTFMVLYGQSNTGKSVLIRFFEKLIGKENTSSLSMHELSMRFYPSQLYNRLVNSCADNSALPLQSIENLKKITGGDPIMHEKKGKEPFFFVPFAKLIFSFNQMPLQLEEKSNAFYKRMRVLAMETELFLNDEYVDDLCSEASIVEVIPHLLRLLPLKAIPRTENSDKAVEALRQDSDSIHAFTKACCYTNSKAWVTKATLYENYVKYCIDNGRDAHKKHAFIRQIISIGFTDARHPVSREICWKGIGMKRREKK